MNLNKAVAVYLICLPVFFVVSNGQSLDYWQERAWTLCLDSFWNSCVGRCGQTLYGPPYLCTCDELCRFYDDCCLDYEYECTWTTHLGNSSTTPMPLFNPGRMSCVGLATIMEYGILMVSSCAPWWPKGVDMAAEHNTTRALCLAPEPSSLKPVIGVHLGYIYKNDYCAKCNGVANTEPWAVVIKCSNESKHGNESRHHWRHSDWLHACTIELDFNGINSSHARACAYKIGQCPVQSEEEKESSELTDTNSTSNFELTSEEEEECTKYSKPIMVPNKDQSMTIYKNIHCARCNGHLFNNLLCPEWELHTFERKESDGTLEMTKTIFYETGVSADTRGASLPNLPASFSVLFFFHQSGHIRTMFTSHDDKWWKKCDDNQIWDPFWQTCRDVYCSTIFDIVNFNCIIDVNSDPSGGMDISNMTNYNNITQLDNVDVSKVELVFHIRMQFPIDDQMETILRNEFSKSLSVALNFSTNRLTNYTTYNDSYYNDTYTCSEVISLVLLGPLKDHPDEATIEKITGTIAYGVSLDQFWLSLPSSGYTVKVSGIQEKIIQLSNSTYNYTDENDEEGNQWCSDGLQIMYQNDQFTPIVHPYSANNVSVSLYINATGITYLPGQFIANILMEGPQGSPLVNVSGIAVVCDKSDHNDSCVHVMIGPTDYTPLPNGSIICNLNSTNLEGTYLPDDYEILPNGNALVCLPVSFPTFDPSTDAFKEKLRDLQAQSYLTTILLSISSSALLATIVTYLLFKPMRNVPGWIILNLCISLLAFQLLYLSGMRFTVYLKRDLCKGVAVFLHWTILASFFWMNVTAFDLYRTFSHLLTSPMTKKGSKKILIYYGIYSYGSASAVVITCICLDQFSRLVIGYGEDGWCWIGNTVALAIAFAGVIGLILLANLIFYILTIYCIRRMASKASMVAGYSASRNQLTIYVRISTVMGFSWALGYLEGVPSFSYVVHDIFAYAFIIANCLSGVFIFAAFVCNRKAFQLYKQSPPFQWAARYWSKAMASKCNECKQTGDKCVCPKSVSRTISNETRQSVLSHNEDDENDEPINTDNDVHVN